MAATYEPIASQTLGSNASSVTFSSIPGTFTDLVVVIYNEATDNGRTEFVLNGDTGTNYSSTYLQGTGSVASSGRRTNTTFIGDGHYQTANDQVVGRSFYMSYSNTNVYKTALFETASPSEVVQRNVALWRSTAAISQILIRRQVGNFKAGSTFSLYGIKAA